MLQASARDTENATGGKETGGVGHRMVAASPAVKASCFSVVKKLLLFSDRRACNLNLNKQLVDSDSEPEPEPASHAPGTLLTRNQCRLHKTKKHTSFGLGT